MGKTNEKLLNCNFQNILSNHIKKGSTMTKLSSKMKHFLSRVDNRTVRLVVTLTSLVLFVLAAGAPGGLGGIGMQ
jgi:hypothetical protein